jgi:mitofusin
VHFVDSASTLQLFTANPAFDDLEQSLRSFVLVKRSKSKPQPVSTYLSKLLADIELLAGANAIVVDSELQRAHDDLSQVQPVLEKMKSGRDVLEEALESVEEAGEASSRTKAVLNDALERVGQGQLGIEKSFTPMPSYGTPAPAVFRNPTSFRCTTRLHLFRCIARFFDVPPPIWIQ